MRSRESFAARPTHHAANIPLAELRQRPFELPPAEADVAVADTGSDATEAVEILAELGRRPLLVGARYVEPTHNRFRLWRASSLLDLVDAKPPTRALCLACGVGREAVVLAAKGWRVTAIDLLPDAIERGRRLERAYLPPGSPAIEWSCADLRRPLLEQVGDFELITQFFYSDSQTVQRVTRHLTTGGIALIEAFSAQHWRALGRSKPDGVSLDQDWSPCIANATEGWHQGRHVARIVVRKPDDPHHPSD